MNKLVLAGAAAIAVAGLPATAQEADTAPVSAAAPAGSYTMTSEQQAAFDTWPAERQTIYVGWDEAGQGYYWTLTPVQQKGYWMLTDDQRTQIYNMSPEQRELAWNSIEQQLAGLTPATPAGQANPPGEGIPTAGVPAPQTAEQSVRPAMPADGSYQGGPYKGALTPPPATAMNKEYPVCTAKLQDSCRNPGGA